MKAVSPVVPGIDFKEHIVAEHQDEYENLPVVHIGEGVLLSRWELTDEEKQFVAEHGYIHLYQWGGNQPLTPVLLEAKRPTIGKEPQRAVSSEDQNTVE